MNECHRLQNFISHRKALIYPGPRIELLKTEVRTNGWWQTEALEPAADPGFVGAILVTEFGLKIPFLA